MEAEVSGRSCTRFRSRYIRNRSHEGRDSRCHLEVFGTSEMFEFCFCMTSYESTKSPSLSYPKPSPLNSLASLTSMSAVPTSRSRHVDPLRRVSSIDQVIFEPVLANSFGGHQTKTQQIIETEVEYPYLMMCFASQSGLLFCST